MATPAGAGREWLMAASAPPAHAAVEAAQEVETDVDEADQRGHLDQRADDGGEGDAGEAEDRDGHGDGEFEVVARRGEGERRGARIVGAELRAITKLTRNMIAK